ncbi:MAG: hypothetical protein QOD77_1618 [Thermoplasmata archaeon]|jgi:hypothetical protein|nr:hypothetical protein [Thermoplasmata archaeon]
MELLPATTDTQQAPRAPRTRVFTKYVLPSERNPFALHFDLLKRIVLRTRNGQEAVAAEKFEGEGIPTQAASMNVRFLKEIRLLTTTDRGLYLPTAECIRFVNARSVDEARAKPILKELLLPTWFAELAMEQLRLEPVMSEDRLIGEFALAAETDKAKKGAALRVILDYLAYAGILNRDERGVTLPAASPVPAAVPMATSSALTVPPQVATQQAPVPPAGPTPAFAPSPPPLESGEWRVMNTDLFQVRVKADVEAVDELKEFLDTLRRSIERRQRQAAKPADDSPPFP